MSKHPLPWSVRRHEPTINQHLVDIVSAPDDNGDTIQVAWMVDKANARLIVAAVNGHADLVAACNRVLCRLDTLIGLGDAQSLDSALSLRAAIAKAEGVKS